MKLSKHELLFVDFMAWLKATDLEEPFYIGDLIDYFLVFVEHVQPDTQKRPVID